MIDNETNQIRKRHGSSIFYTLLESAAETHDRKSHDYASTDNPYGNYHFAGELAALFSHSPRDMGFVGRIGEKLYRLANLEKDGKIPKNESVEDTEIDIITITTLWVASRREERMRRVKEEKIAYDRQMQNSMDRQSRGIEADKTPQYPEPVQRDTRSVFDPKYRT